MESKLTKRQVKTETKTYTENGTRYKIVAEIRYDDECGNGHNSFAITADIYEQRKDGGWRWFSGGCCHDEIVKRFPKFAHLIKWHLCSSDGPMHYIANTLYHAGDRDCNGLRAGEVRSWDYAVRFDDVPIFHDVKKDFWDFLKDRIGTGDFQCICFAHPKDPKTYSPNWSLVGYGDGWYGSPFHRERECRELCEALNRCTTHFDKVPHLISEGKERDLDAARSSAIWPDATDADLTAPDLKQKLQDRLPALLAEFKKAIESLGFVY